MFKRGGDGGTVGGAQPIRKQRSSVARSTPEVDAARLRRIGDIPAHLKGIFAAAWRGRSRKMALKAHCVECMGYQRALVKGCTSLACALYPYRPYQTEEDTEK